MQASQILIYFPEKSFSEVWEEKIKSIKSFQPQIDENQINTFKNNLNKIFLLDDKVNQLKKYFENNNIEITDNDYESILKNWLNIIKSIIWLFNNAEYIDLTKNNLFNILEKLNNELTLNSYLADEYKYNPRWWTPIHIWKKIIDSNIEELDKLIRIIKLENDKINLIEDIYNKQFKIINDEIFYLKEEVWEKNKIINETSKEQTKSLIWWFEELKDNFSLEERRWLVISIIIFFISISFSIIVLIDSVLPEYTKSFLYNFSWWFVLIILWILLALTEDLDKNKSKTNISKTNIKFLSYPKWINLKNTSIKTIFFWYAFINLYIINTLWWIWKFNSSLFKIEKSYYTLIPISIILFSFLYFSIYQYSKAKQLRIENQNKIAMLHGFQAIKTDLSTWIEKWRFYNNIADVVFSKVYIWKNNNNLPIDKIIEIIKLTKKD